MNTLNHSNCHYTTLNLNVDFTTHPFHQDPIGGSKVFCYVNIYLPRTSDV